MNRELAGRLKSRLRLIDYYKKPSITGFDYMEGYLKGAREVMREEVRWIIRLIRADRRSA